MLEQACKMNGRALRIEICDSGVKETPMGTCIQMRRAIKNFWKLRKIEEFDYTCWGKTNHEEVK